MKKISPLNYTHPNKRTSENHGPKPPSPNHRTLGVNYTEYKEMFYIIFLIYTFTIYFFLTG